MSLGTDASGPTQEGRSELEIWRWSALVWRARRFVGVLTLAGAVLLVGHALLEPPAYKASARLLIARPASVRSNSPDSTVADYLALAGGWSTNTQVEALKSEGLAARALASLPADQQAYFPARIERLRDRISTEVGRDSDLVTVRTVSASAEACVALANSVVNCYIGEMQEAARELAAAARAIVEPELTQTRGLLLDTEEELAKQRGVSGVYDPKRERELAVERLTSLRQHHSDGLSELAATRAGLATARERANELPESVPFQHLDRREPQVVPLAEELAQLEGKLAKLEQEYAPQSPEVQRVTRQVEAVRALLEQPPIAETVQHTEAVNPVREDMEKRVSALQVQEAHLMQQASELERQINAEAGRLDRISAEEVAQTSLAAQVEALRSQHKALAMEMETLRLRAAARLPSAAVLERASLETTVQQKPDRLRLGIAGAFLGFLAGSLVAVAAGARPRRDGEASARAAEG